MKRPDRRGRVGIGKYPKQEDGDEVDVSEFFGFRLGKAVRGGAGGLGRRGGRVVWRMRGIEIWWTPFDIVVLIPSPGGVKIWETPFDIVVLIPSTGAIKIWQTHVDSRPIIRMPGDIPLSIKRASKG